MKQNRSGALQKHKIHLWKAPSEYLVRMSGIQQYFNNKVSLVVHLSSFLLVISSDLPLTTIALLQPIYRYGLEYLK